MMRAPSLAGALAALLCATPLPAQSPPSETAPGPAAEAPASGTATADDSAGVTVTPERLQWNPAIRRFELRSFLPPAAPPQALPAARKDEPPHRRNARAALNRLIHQGRAAGFAGLLYDNRDRGHSTLDMADYPGLVPVLYGPALRAEKSDYGQADRFLFDRPTIGNSSTAFKQGAAPRSLPRAAMTRPGGAAQAALNYMSNHLYVYPEHRDHDRVDLYPANWPYMIISQGSSYQDRPFVQAALWTLAAMTPETRAFLEREGLVAPTLQMILRRSQAHVRSRQAYLAGSAHPTVFQQDALRLDRMVALAQSLTPQTVPPVPVLEVLSDEFSPQAGLTQLSERLFDTPSSVARLWRGFEWEKEMILRVQAVGGLVPEDISFTWVLLRGDPARVRIEPLDAAGTRARVVVNWQGRQPIAPREERLSDRVDIGVFASTATMDSAPAFLSVSFPPHQTRRYAPGPDGVPQLAEIDYGAGADRPVPDPLLYWQAPWRDVYDTPDGPAGGWTRQFADGRDPARFTADGRLAESGAAVVYTVKRRREGAAVLTMQPADEPE